jgi:hypothetical protein
VLILWRGEVVGVSGTLNGWDDGEVGEELRRDHVARYYSGQHLLEWSPDGGQDRSNMWKLRLDVCLGL